jgi:hypothetical protein
MGRRDTSSRDRHTATPDFLRFFPEAVGTQVATVLDGSSQSFGALSHHEGVHMIGTAFGFGTPLAYPTQPLNPYSSTLFGAPGTPPAQHPNVTQTLQQVVQLLQFLPHQLQQLQQQQYVQHQQLQQLLHAIPGQLAQLQQLIQFVPHQIQQLQQGAPFQQPFGQIGGATGYGISTPWGIAPQTIGAQPSQVM